MKISLKAWVIFILIAVLSIGVWYKFEYPQFNFVDLSIDRKEALSKAEFYLVSRGLNPKEYLKAIVFEVNDWADRYLQKTIGIKSEEEFIKEHDYELFSWRVRFFKELKKEEYVVVLSPKSGNILSFHHLIEDTEPRETLEKEIARIKAEEFLKNNCGLNLTDYDFHEEKVKRYDKRLDYSFSWEKKGVYIPWKEKQGGAKLLAGVTVSGQEIRQFYKNNLDIPEKFQRYIQNQLMLGEYLWSFAFILFICLVAIAANIIIKRRHILILRICKKLFFYLAIFIFIINIVSLFNNLESIIINYPTSTYLASFLGLFFQRVVLSLVFFCISFALPAFAAEALHSEAFSANKYGSFLHYLRTTFYSRQVSKFILLGYLLFFIMLGLQAAVFYFGHKYMGVWKEWLTLTRLSSSYLPFLSAFILGATASFSEEIVYRFFGITLVKKYFKNTVIAIALPALIWGFGHSAYAIFPVWFRGIEVSLIGFLFGFIFIRYGLIPLLVAHYLFDVFWGVAGYILGQTTFYLFVSALLVLALPLMFAIIAYIINREEKEREIKPMLNATEEYNLNILKTFVSLKKSQGMAANLIKEELLRHNWDSMLVDLALGEVVNEYV